MLEIGEVYEWTNELSGCRGERWEVVGPGEGELWLYAKVVRASRECTFGHSLGHILKIGGETCKPSWVLCDPFITWAAKVRQEAGVIS